MSEEEKGIWQILKIPRRRAAEISVDVYLLLSEDIGFVDGIKKLVERYKGNELLIALWSYAYQFAIGDAIVNGWLWAVQAYQETLAMIELAKKDKEKAIEAIEQGLKKWEMLQKEKRYDFGYVM